MSRSVKNSLLVGISILIYLGIVYLLFSIEQNQADSNIKSFWDALWYSIITLTTIGYGDHFPVSLFGRIVALVFVLGSIGILGFVISKISSKIYKIMEDKKMGYLGTSFEDHVVIINWNNFARQIVKEIVTAEKKVVIITEKKDDVDFIYKHFDNKLVFVLHSETLEEDAFLKSNLKKANTVLLNYEDDTDNLVNLIALKKSFPKLSYVISLNNPTLKNTFKQLGVTFTLAKNEVASKLIASYVFEPEVAKVTEGLMSSVSGKDDMGIMQFKVISLNPYINYNCLDAFIELKKNYNVILTGISKLEGDDYQLIKNPNDRHIINENDYLIIMGNSDGRNKMIEILKVEEGI